MNCILAVCIAVLFASAYSQSPTQFQASFTAYNNPLVLGTMLGTINYDAVNSLIRNDYTFSTNPPGIIMEFFNFTGHLRYLFCTACDAQTWTTSIPVYHSDGLTAQGTANINGQVCTQYATTDSGDPVQTIYTASNGLPCRAVYTTGEIIDFSNFAPINNAAFTMVPSWNCPVQQCNREMDVVLIFDESGSIVPADFAREVAFGTSVAQNFVFGPTSVGMALIQFSGTARDTIHMSFIQQSFLNSMAAVFQLGGATCIGCGLSLAQQEVNANGRPGIPKLFIMLTDGQNNVQVNVFPQVLAGVKGAGIIIFAIGVGNFVDPNEILMIATSSSLAFPQVPSFSALQGFITSLVSLTCAAFPSNPCGPACQGFCACKGTCVCPSSCNDNNVCTTDSCTPGVANTGCTHTAVVCNDNSFCTTKSCNPASGCVFTAITCQAPDICHTASCVPSVGCEFPAVNCNLNSPCYIDSCNVTAGGCVHTPQNCSKCMYPVVVTCPTVLCYNSKCNPNTGMCQNTPIDCNDNNACTTDSCDPNTGMCVHTRITCNDNSACTHKYCDPVLGCFYIPFNSTDCSDDNVCTIDTCVPATGCVHTNISCNPNNTCIQGLCNTVSGCYYQPFNCLTIPRIAKFIGTCYQALCSPSMNGCYLNQLPGTTIDQCGVCNGNNGCKNFIQLPSNVPLVIAGGSLAAIVVGAILLFIAIAAFGGKKGYDIWLAHRNNMSGASTNPLYNDSGMTGRNPMYSSRITRV